MSFFRRDPVTGRWTIINPEKKYKKTEKNLSSPEGTGGLKHGGRTFCPFCPGHEEKTPPAVLIKETQSSRPWAVRVVPNKFPALDSSSLSVLTTIGIYDRMSGFGIHEVIIETPSHTTSFPDLELEHATEVVRAWKERYKDTSKDPRIRYILLFRNRGGEAGATLAHPHSQLIALPIIPRLVMEELDGSQKYYEWKERCVFCDMIRDEELQGLRIITSNDNFVAFAPYASRFAYETWILPRKHQSHFADVEGQEDQLASILKDVLGQLDQALDFPAYNLLIHSAPCDEGDLVHYHWHIEIMPRLTRIAGFEWGTGFYLNPVLPEDAARTLRTV